MSRPLLIRSSIHPYHITACCDEFPIPLIEVWSIMIQKLCAIKQFHSIEILAFVLMNNHFHLICYTPNANVSEVMHSFMRSTSIAISHSFKWKKRYRWSLIETDSHICQVYRFVLQNPVRHGIVERIESYPFSLFNSLHPDEVAWLNEKISGEHLSLIRRGLQKAFFSVNQKQRKAFLKLGLPPNINKVLPASK